MKEPEEYLKKVNSLTLREELYEIGKQIQIDAYNEALGDAAHAVRLSLNGSNTPYAEHCCNGNQNWTVNKSFILKLKK